MKDLIIRNFEATKKRGKITDKTKISDFIKKMHEEDGEALMAMIQFIKNPNHDHRDKMAQELIDKVMVPLNFLQHIGVDIELALCKNVIYQENRED